MNRSIPLILFLLSSFQVLYAQSPSYLEGNGTILRQFNADGYDVLIRRHEQRVRVGNFLDDERRSIYDEPYTEGRVEVGRLELGEYIDVSELAIVTAGEQRSVWLRIVTDDGREGWIYGTNQDPYANDTWAVLEHIEAPGRVWTARKLEQSFLVAVVLNVRDTPGVQGSQVLFQLRPRGSSALTVRSLAVTEEVEVIDGRRDRWIQIVDENGRVGWVFGGYADVGRGGPKYFIPEDRISSRLDPI